jgi:hypothetical protein
MTDSERLKATISQISQNFAKKLKLLKQTQSVSEKEAQKYQNLKRKSKSNSKIKEILHFLSLFFAFLKYLTFFSERN